MSEKEKPDVDANTAEFKQGVEEREMLKTRRTGRENNFGSSDRSDALMA